VPGLELLINSLGDARCRPQYVESLRQYLRAQTVLSEDSRRLIETNPLRVLDSKIDRPRLADPPSMVDHLCDDCRGHFQGVRDLLDTLGIDYTLDDSLVRGLDYYTRTAFEFIGGGLETAQNAVGGGGRYDGLAESLGGRATPGVGFALGVDRILLSLGETGRPHLDAFLVSETSPAETMEIVSDLRRQGLRVDFDGEGRSVKAQFRMARRLGAPVVLVFGGDAGAIDVQRESDRTTVPLNGVAGAIKGAP
jgi:histidyl-tRNA synthetase